MNKMKYIIVDTGLYDSIIIFDHIMQHRDMASKINLPVISAGFVVIVDGKFQCYGESISLKIKSRPEDSDYVNKFMGVAY